MSEIVKLLLMSFGSVAYLFVISKLSGKKQIAQLEFIDYVMGISIGSIAAEMATDLSDSPFWYYLVAMAVFFLFDYSVSILGRKGAFFKRFFKGKPMTIIYNGKLDYQMLKKSKLDVNEVLAMCREQGYFDINDIAYAIFENSGVLSVLPKANQKPTVASDFGIKPDEPSLSHYMIIDGNLSYSSLTDLKKDKEWLFKRLKVSDKKELNNILLAEYVEKTDKMIIHYKIEPVKECKKLNVIKKH